MTAFSKTFFIVNPAAGGGRAGAMWPEVRRLAEKKIKSFRTMTTVAPGDAAVFARKAAESGADRLVCLGGDGVLNEVINGVMRARLGPSRKPAVGYIPCGTGMDFRKTAPIPSNPKEALDVIAEGRAMCIDLGIITFRDHSGKSASRYFHNVASFGLGGEVDRKIGEQKHLSGPLAYFRAAFLSLLKFGRKRVFINVDDRVEGFATVWNVAVCNGRRHGGGMKVAREALLDDGLFHVTILGDLNLFEVFCKFPKLYTGNLKGSKMHTFAGRKIQASSKQKVLIDVDGECPGTLPVSIEIVPGAIDLIVDKR